MRFTILNIFLVSYAFCEVGPPIPLPKISAIEVINIVNNKLYNSTLVLTLPVKQPNTVVPVNELTLK